MGHSAGGYSFGGDAWSSFSHDHARFRAYRWGEDGLAGVSDDRQQLCLAVALWNGNDPKVRSVVGLMPLAAATVVGAAVRQEFPELVELIREFLDRHPSVTAALPARGRQAYEEGPALIALFDEDRLRRILGRMLDEDEFLAPHGIRFRALLNLDTYFGDRFTVECPSASGKQHNLYQVAEYISERLIATFRQDSDGRRPVVALLMLVFRGTELDWPRVRRRGGEAVPAADLSGTGSKGK